LQSGSLHKIPHTALSLECVVVMVMVKLKI
jgi:hypothetical protein